MKVLHVASHLGVYRGGAVQLCRMAMGQRRRGHEVMVIAAALPRRASPEVKKRDSATWDPLRAVGIEVMIFNYSSPLGILRLRRIMKSGNFDILHAHRDEALVACWRATVGLRRPALIAQRGTDRAAKKKVFQAFHSPRTRAVVAVSQAVKDGLLADSQIDSAKVNVIYGSVDLTEFASRPPVGQLREKLGIPPSARVIGSFSAFRKAKGLDVLVGALAPILQSNPDVHAVFLGKKVKRKLRPIADELGVKERLHLLDHQSNVAEWLSIMDLTVVAAVGREGLSGVLRESLAMEIPVISTDCAGNGEIVRDRQTGLLIPMRDAKALREAIEWALAHPGEMKSMAREGRRWVEENCGIEVQAEKLERLYKSVLT